MIMDSKRILLFLIGCIGTRLAIVYMAYKFREDHNVMRILGILALIPAIGFLSIYFMGWRKRGPEVNGELIWWNDIRPIHGLLWLSFATCAIMGIKTAWMFLLIDVLFGLFMWIVHRCARCL
jgi:hypothetical protein